MVFDIFHAGMVWIAACESKEIHFHCMEFDEIVTMRELNPIYLENLELCLQMLKEIQV